MRPFSLQLSLLKIPLFALLRREEVQNPAITSLLSSSTHCLEGEYDSLLRITFTIADNAEFRSKISLESCFKPWATRVEDFYAVRKRERQRERERERERERDRERDGERETERDGDGDREIESETERETEGERERERERQRGRKRERVSEKESGRKKRKELVKQCKKHKNQSISVTHCAVL
jgi:hypothetical protein